MPKCDYLGCGRDEHRDSKCIFHLPKKTEDEARLFMRGLFEEKKKAEEAPDATEIDFRGYVFPAYVTFPEDTEFKKSVRLDEAIFEGYVCFRKSRFSGHAVLSGAKFSRDAVFSEVTFMGDAEFIRATFSGDAVFDEAEFLGEAWFVEVTFSGYTRFNGATFKGIAEFVEARVSENAMFSGAAFNEHVRFSGAEFGRDAWFDGVTFKQGAAFHGVTFRRDVVFDRAKFSRDALFYGATFNGNTWFDRATFKRQAEFVEVTFSRAAYFRETLFLEGLFMGARFKGVTVFERTVFQRDKSRSGDLTPLVGSGTDGKMMVTRFDGAIVEQNAEVRFIQPKERKDGELRNYAIDHVSFLNVDLDRFNFQDVEWGTYKGRRAVIEEVLMGRPPFEDVTPEKVRQIYARIRTNQEKAMRHAEAGDFFIGEMEMRKLARAPGPGRVGWIKRNVSMLGIYCVLCKYGESYWRPIGALLLSVPFFALVRLLATPVNQAGLYASQISKQFLEFLWQSMLTAFQFGTVGPIELIQRIWSGLLLGLTFIAMKRQFERQR